MFQNYLSKAFIFYTKQNHNEIINNDLPNILKFTTFDKKPIFFNTYICIHIFCINNITFSTFYISMKNEIINKIIKQNQLLHH